MDAILERVTFTLWFERYTETSEGRSGEQFPSMTGTLEMPFCMDIKEGDKREIPEKG